MNSAASEQSARALIRDEAANWFARAQTSVFSADEQAQFDAWLDQSHSHRAAYWRLEGAWEEAERLSALKPVRLSAPTSAKRISISLKVLAAGILVAALVGVTRPYFEKPTPQIYATNVGGRKILTLADGSRIELNTSTTIRMVANGSERKVWLDRGEAYFQIVHDTARPFTVIAGNRRIVDLGTKFVARQEGGALEVSLVEGRARVEISGNSVVHPTELLPGDVAVASATSISVKRELVGNLDNQLGWRRGVLVFKGETLAKAVSEMNRYNTNKLVVRDPQLARQTIDGTFPVHAVRQFAEMAQAVFGLRTETQGNQTIITR